MKEPATHWRVSLFIPQTCSKSLSYFLWWVLTFHSIKLKRSLEISTHRIRSLHNVILTLKLLKPASQPISLRKISTRKCETACSHPLTCNYKSWFIKESSGRHQFSIVPFKKKAAQRVPQMKVKNNIENTMEIWLLCSFDVLIRGRSHQICAERRGALICCCFHLHLGTADASVGEH